MTAIHWRSLRVITTGIAFAGLGLMGCGKDSNGPNAVDPTADFTSNCAQLLCTFTDASDDDGAIASWAWDFGDGQVSTSQSPAHDFLGSGSYKVTLTVTDGDANTGSKQKTVTVVSPGSNVAPTVNFDVVCAALRCDLRPGVPTRPGRSSSTTAPRPGRRRSPTSTIWSSGSTPFPDPPLTQ